MLIFILDYSCADSILIIMPFAFPFERAKQQLAYHYIYTRSIPCLCNSNMAALTISKKHHKHLNNPFPSNSKSLPFIHGALFFTQTIPSHQIFPVGQNFLLTWVSKNGGSLSISHQSQPTRHLWSTIPGQAFVSAALAETEVEESRGSFVIKDKNVQSVCNYQTVEDIRVINESDLWKEEKDQEFPTRVSGLNDKNEFKNTQFPALLIKGRIFTVKKRKKRLVSSGVEENFHFLEREPSTSAKYWLLFDQKNSNQIGFELRIGKSNFPFQERVSPKMYKCCGRKLGRIRKLRSRLFVRRKGYATVTSVEENMVVKAARPTEFSRVCLTYSSEKNERFYGFGEQFSHMNFKGKRVPIFVQEQGIGRGDQPSELIECFTETIGRPPELPGWIISGAVVGMQGGTDTVRRVWDQLKTYNVPVSALWLQDWVGQRETVIGSQLWWNWEVDNTRYRGWKKLTKDLTAENIKVMTYCNPCLAPMEGKTNIRRNHFEEAKKLDILVKDSNGKPYMVPNTAFDVGMLDLSHPHTATWFKQVLQDMVDDGVRGWMADFGEGLPVDACLYSGLICRLLSSMCRLFDNAFLKYQRSEELLFRWMELNAFTTVFRTHEGNKPSCNSQFYSNPKTLSHFARLAKVYKAWKFYRIQLIKEASQKGLPVCRHLFLHYPDDDHVHSLTYEQFLVGTEILVVPVLDKGKKDVKAYFPLGECCPWKHIWTGNLYTKQGSEVWIEAQIGYPAIFVKDGSLIGETFLEKLREYNIL